MIFNRLNYWGLFVKKNDIKIKKKWIINTPVSFFDEKLFESKSWWCKYNTCFYKFLNHSRTTTVRVKTKSWIIWNIAVLVILVFLKVRWIAYLLYLWVVLLKALTWFFCRRLLCYSARRVSGWLRKKSIAPPIPFRLSMFESFIREGPITYKKTFRSSLVNLRWGEVINHFLLIFYHPFIYNCIIFIKNLQKRNFVLPYSLFQFHSYFKIYFTLSNIYIYLY